MYSGSYENHQVANGSDIIQESQSGEVRQYSTDRYAGRLYFRVRNGTGCDPAAMAVIPKHGISKNYIIFTYRKNWIGNE